MSEFAKAIDVFDKFDLLPLSRSEGMNHIETWLGRRLAGFDILTAVGVALVVVAYTIW